MKEKDFNLFLIGWEPEARRKAEEDRRRSMHLDRSQDVARTCLKT